MDPAFIRREIDAINEKWREIQSGSDRKGEALAIDYRLCIHPKLWESIRDYLINISVDSDPFAFPGFEFLELAIECNATIEGWLILPR